MVGQIVDGVVLAAGASSRMGRSKAQLEVDGTTFLERAVHLLRDAGCRYVVAVVNGDDDWSARLADVSGAAVVVNDRPESEQIDSLRLGLAQLPDDSTGAVVLPVDCPRVKLATVQAVIDEFALEDAAIVNPAYNGQSGHPVVFARRVWPELLTGALPDGARSVIDAHDDARIVEVDDPGVLIDVDTPADYQQHVE
jgi:CTP:molybdopterin cytidylyltransferase MocA